MKIIKKGTIVHFDCGSCGCKFDVGINVVRDNDGNYYADCPMCGTDCHANVNDLERNIFADIQ